MDLRCDEVKQEFSWIDSENRKGVLTWSFQRLRRIHELDLNRQNTLHQVDLVNRDEEARRLKLRALTLRNENAILKDKISQKETRLLSIATQDDLVRTELADAQEQARTQEARLKKGNMEITNLKVRSYGLLLVWNWLTAASG